MTSVRQRMTEDMQVRNLSPHTQTSYVQQVSLFARHFGKSPEVLGTEEIRTYQVYLTNEKKLAPSSILLAVSALRFLYKVTLHKNWTLEDVIPAPKKPQKLPIVRSPEEVLLFLDCVASLKHRTILTTCYAAGLRISVSFRLACVRKLGRPISGRNQLPGFAARRYDRPESFEQSRICSPRRDAVSGFPQRVRPRSLAGPAVSRSPAHAPGQPGFVPAELPFQIQRRWPVGRPWRDRPVWSGPAPRSGKRIRRRDVRVLGTSPADPLPSGPSDPGATPAPRRCPGDGRCFSSALCRSSSVR